MDLEREAVVCCLNHSVEETLSEFAILILLACVVSLTDDTYILIVYM